MISIAVLFVLVQSTIGFCLSIILKKNDIADVLWGIGFIFLSALLFFNGANNSGSILLYTLIFLWALRLSLYIYIKQKQKKIEDARYKQWRNSWGKWCIIRSFFQIFFLQTLFLLLVATPLFLQLEHNNISALNILGILIFTFGLVYESVADYQMMHFKKENNNKGKIITQGLWKYSRHPNYFGEILVWIGIFFASLHNIESLIGIVSPLTIIILLAFVSGVPLAEKRYKGRKDFEEYKKTTPAIIPKLG